MARRATKRVPVSMLARGGLSRTGSDNFGILRKDNAEVMPAHLRAQQLLEEQLAKSEPSYRNPPRRRVNKAMRLQQAKRAFARFTSVPRYPQAQLPRGYEQAIIKSIVAGTFRSKDLAIQAK